LRSFVIVLVMGLAAFMVMSGPFALLRIALFPHSPTQDSVPSIAHFLGGMLGVGVNVVWIIIGALFQGISIMMQDGSKPNRIYFWGAVVGLGGAFIGSLFKGYFRWEVCEDPRELRRQIGGAALLGSRAAIATGCRIGQGLSGFAVLAISAPITLSLIFVGAYFGLHQLIAGFQLAD